MSKSNSIKTKCVHSGTIKDSHACGSISPIFPATSHAYLDLDKKAYPRYFNTPNQEALAAKLAVLENGESGLIMSSGMAAISTAMLSFLRQGDHAVIQQKLYGGTTNFIHTSLGDFGIDYSTTAGLAVQDFENCIQQNTKLIYLETPSNPLLEISDIAAVAKLAQARGITTIIDNTFASPVNQNPLDFGIDIVVHSATKYLSGHSDICAGAIVGSSAVIEKIIPRARVFGGSLNAQTCALLERSVKTLALRVKQQNDNAQKIAEFLAENARIEKVNYPGLPSHSGHELARKQMHGFGGMLSFVPESAVDVVEFQKHLKLIKPSMSLGGIESTICSSALTSHALVPREQRLAEGISDNLLRLSVGIEDAADLIADLQQALQS